MAFAEGFMDIARCARLQLYSSMGKIPESVEIVPVGGNIKVDKSLNTYLTIYKGMTKKNDYRKEKIAARFSCRCWVVLLRLESKLQGGNFTRNNEFNSYFFRWLSATMPEEEIYNNLIALDNGEVDVKTLIKRYKKSASNADKEERDESQTREVENHRLVLQVEELKKELATERAQVQQLLKLNKVLENELLRTQNILSEERARAQSVRIACRESKDRAAKLQKVASEDKESIDELRKTLRKELEERNNLRRLLEEECSKHTQLVESSAKQIEDLKVEISRLKAAFIHEETDSNMVSGMDQKEKKAKTSEVKESKMRLEQDKKETITRAVKLSCGAVLTLNEMTAPMYTVNQPKSAMETGELKMELGEANKSFIENEVEVHLASVTGQSKEEDRNAEETEELKMELGEANKSFIENEVEVHLASATGQSKEEDGNEEQPETAPEWVAVAYSKLRYYARIVTERAETMDVQFLYPRGNDIYAFKKSRTTETIENRQVFARNLKLTIKGEGYSVMGEKEVRLKYAEHVKKMAPLLKVESLWDFDHQRDLNKVICAMQMGKVAIGDFKTIQPCMDTADRQLMNAHMGKTFSVGWLNDEVMNVSLEIISSDHERDVNIRAIPSFVINKVLNSTPVQLKCWSWVKNTKVTQHDILLVAVNPLNHWTLGVVDFSKKAFLHYDSKSGSGNGHVFFDCMRKLLMICDVEVDSWAQAEEAAPQQKDCSSCGVFALKIAQCIAKGRKLTFTQDDIKDIRYEVAYKIIEAGKSGSKYRKNTDSEPKPTKDRASTRWPQHIWESELRE